METHNETKSSNRERQSTKAELLEQLLRGRSTEQDLFGPEGLDLLAFFGPKAA